MRKCSRVAFGFLWLQRAHENEAEHPTELRADEEPRHVAYQVAW